MQPIETIVKSCRYKGTGGLDVNANTFSGTDEKAHHLPHLVYVPEGINRHDRVIERLAGNGALWRYDLEVIR
jgi:hypothetical protein